MPIIDRDGDLDIVVTTNDGPAYLFRNDGGNRNNWICVRLVGRKSNRDGIGAVVRVGSKSGKQWNMVRSGSSYCSQSDLALTFGLGGDPEVQSDRDRVAQRREAEIAGHGGESVSDHRRDGGDRGEGAAGKN